MAQRRQFHALFEGRIPDVLIGRHLDDLGPGGRQERDLECLLWIVVLVHVDRIKNSLPGVRRAANT